MLMCDGCSVVYAPAQFVYADTSTRTGRRRPRRAKRDAPRDAPPQRHALSGERAPPTSIVDSPRRDAATTAPDMPVPRDPAPPRFLRRAPAHPPLTPLPPTRRDDRSRPRDSSRTECLAARRRDRNPRAPRTMRPAAHASTCRIRPCRRERAVTVPRVASSPARARAVM